MYYNLRIRHFTKINLEILNALVTLEFLSDGGDFEWMVFLLLKNTGCSFTVRVKADNSFCGVTLLNQRGYV